MLYKNSLVIFKTHKLNKPVTKDELRFVESWKEQREGSRVKYYLLYTLAWGFVATLSSFFIIIFMGGISIIPIAKDNYKIALIIGVGIAVGFIIAVVSFNMNERRYQKLLERVRNKLRSN